uniref:Ig-like domain-containing protein n=1 Tax=Panthera leo TaxID=9689 RepID=A0A8C8XN57_PANLE
MAWALVLFGLLTQDTGSWAQSALNQPPSVSGDLGRTVTISCAGTSNDIGRYNDISWYQQLEGTSPRLLVYSVNSRPSGIPDHFSGSKSGNTASLTISGLQAEDEADYHCSSYAGSSIYTVVPLYGEVRPKPSLYLQPPSIPVQRDFMQHGLENSGLSALLSSQDKVK